MLVVRAVDYENFTTDTGVTQTLLAPRDEFGNGDPLVDGWYDDRYFGIRDVVLGNEKLHLRVAMTATIPATVPLAR